LRDSGRETRSCRVVVRNEAGEPIWGAAFDLDRNGFLAATTNADGIVEVEWPQGDLQTIEVSHPEYAPCVEVREFASELYVFLKLEPALRGRVMFPDGKPVPGHPIRVAVPGWRLDAGTTTDAQGRFLVRNLTGAEVVVKCVGARPDSTRCGPQARDLRFTLHHSVLVVRPRDEAGKPIEDALVMVRPMRLSTDDFGLHRELVESGTDLEVHVMKRGFRRAIVKVPSWSDHASLHEIEVRLAPAPKGAVLVRAVNADGSTPEQVVVQVWVEGSKEPRFEFVRRAEGEQFRIPDLDPGPVKLILRADHGIYLTRTIEVVARKEPKKVHEVRFPAGGDAVLHWPVGQPGDLVLLVATEGEAKIWAIPEGGRYQPVDQVPVGEYMWRAKRGGKLIREAKVSVRPGETVETRWTEPKK
jgi:hypothetical protein